MTLDFTPDWLSTVSTAEATAATPTCRSVFVPAVPAPHLPPPGAPAAPSMAQVARLVEELFAEGSLSFEQLCSLSNVPELKSLLAETVSGAPSRRRRP
ncbi:MAG: hypothetical protein NVV74_12450 [Magnetospirillum sp.]|nr:hypothetical protein [Magnetospirillum sp.]